eukprot:TRINITY_DN27_c0_g3_i2.p1 TRINITY_DN27_c0_g3~~TRINITY_DN27_c0_g3_i2.p1  ORF type:complete len:2604 (-),score=730.98 TRINITY_DN27_c0_g3_i2:225-7616(-)
MAVMEVLPEVCLAMCMETMLPECMADKGDRRLNLAAVGPGLKAAARHLEVRKQMQTEEENIEDLPISVAEKLASPETTTRDVLKRWDEMEIAEDGSPKRAPGLPTLLGQRHRQMKAAQLLFKLRAHPKIRARRLHAAGRNLQEEGMEEHKVCFNKHQEWDLYDGMSCWHKREIEERKVYELLPRIFSLSGKDAWSGCKGIIDKWMVSGRITKSVTTSKCSEPDRMPDGSWNMKWLKDPCCNWDRQKFECCGPRNMTWEETAITGVDTDEVAKFAAVGGNLQVALDVAMNYFDMESEAQSVCFPAFRAAEEAYKDQWKVVDKCFKAVEGSWSDDFEANIGPKCNTDSDCFTDSCAAPPKKAGSTSSSGSGKEQKYCKTPLDTQDKDFATPVLKCMIDSNEEIAQYFKFKQLKLKPSATASEVVEAMMNMSDKSLKLVNEECRGDHRAHWATDETECLAQKQCNWDHWLKSKEKCENPCAGTNCTSFCSYPGMAAEASSFPTCKPDGDTWFIHELCNQKQREQEETFHRTCKECTDLCDEACKEGECDPMCWAECDKDVCDYSILEQVRTDCFNEECGKICDADGNCAVLDRHDCIFPELSYTADKGDDCKAECLAPGGPQPGSPWRCYGKLDESVATESVCYDLGDGWIESRWDDAVYHGWDWSRGSPPPSYCVVKAYVAVDGKPYVRPPPYGEQCLPDCEEEFNGCMWNRDCYNWLEEESMSIDEKCRTIFDEVSDKFWECEEKKSSECKGAECYRKKSDCLKELGLEKNQDWAEYKCGTCWGSWVDHSEKTMQCGKTLSNPQCKWNETMTNIPCAEECMWEMCWQNLQTCDIMTGDRAACLNETVKLNQCRGCAEHMVRCDDDCSEPCHPEACMGKPPWECEAKTAFWHPEDHYNRCSDCKLAQVADAVCTQDDPCFMNYTCFGEHPPYGPDCSHNCKRHIDGCSDEQLSWCWEWDEERGESNAGKCHELWKYVGDYFWQCRSYLWSSGKHENMTDLEQAQHCAQYVIAGAETEGYSMPKGMEECWQCDGDWNDWQGRRLQQLKCLSGDVTYFDSGLQMPAGCNETCNIDYGSEMMEKGERRLSSQEAHAAGKKTEKELMSRALSSGAAATSKLHAKMSAHFRGAYDMKAQEMKAEALTKRALQAKQLSKDLITAEEHYKNQKSKQAFKQMMDVKVLRAKLDKEEASHMKAVEKIAKATGRRLNVFARAELEQVDLECTGAAACETKAAGCDAFWNRTGAGAARIEGVIQYSKFGAAPWESVDQICDRLGKMCYANMTAVETAVQANYSVPEWCNYDPAEKTRIQGSDGDTECAACSNTTATQEDCPYECQCRSDGMNAYIVNHWGGKKRALCDALTEKLKAMSGSTARKDRGEWKYWIDFDDKLFNGEGGCTHHRYWEAPEECYSTCWAGDWHDGCSFLCNEPKGNTSDCVDNIVGMATPIFNYYEKSRRWEEGRLYENETCEADSCHPDPWARTKERCEDIRYCNGDCPQCTFAEYWNREAENKAAKCQIVDSTGSAITKEADCTTACPATSTCTFITDNRTLKFCMASAPGTSEDMSQACRGNANTGYKFSPLRCSDFPLDACRSWVHKEFPLMQCQIQRLSCKNKIECEKAGRCDYHADDWQIERMGGACVVPYDFDVELDPWGHSTGVEYWEQCEALSMKMDGIYSHSTNYGCVVYAQDNNYYRRLAGLDRAVQTVKATGKKPYVARRLKAAGKKLPAKRRLEKVETPPPGGSKEKEPSLEDIDVPACVAECFGTVLEPYLTDMFMEAMMGKDISFYLEDSCDDLAACDASKCDEMTQWGLQYWYDMDCSSGEEKVEEKMMLEDGKLTAKSCGMLGGKFFQYGWTRPDCEAPGFAWNWTGPAKTQGNASVGHWMPGTYMCCIHGEREWCHDWSMDDNEESCSKCGGTWRSIFQWRKHGGWVVGQWKKSYKWTERSFDSVNSWVKIIGWGPLLTMWESVIAGLKSVVFKNFIQCRIEPTIGNLIALAKQEPPKATLGSATALPGQASTKSVGQVAVNIHEDTIGGSDEVVMEFVKEPAKGAITASSRRLSSSGFLEKQEAETGRQLSNGDIELSASCFTVVKYGPKFVGQLVGDCLQFAPSVPLAGPVTLCIPTKADIPVNPNFTANGFATKNGSTITAIGTTITTKTTADGEQFCGSIQNAGIYCPVKRFDDYITTWKSADNSCGAVEALKTTVETVSVKLVNDGFTGDGSFVAEGEEVVIKDDDDTGVAFGATTEVIQNVNSFAEKAVSQTVVAAGKNSTTTTTSRMVTNTSTTNTTSTTTTTATTTTAQWLAIGFTVQNIEYGQLAASKDLLAGFKNAIATTLASAASGAAGTTVSKDMIEVILSEGSIKVVARVTPPTGSNVQQLTSGLSQGGGALESEVLAALQTVPNIEGVTTGAGISLAGFSINEVDDGTEDDSTTAAAEEDDLEAASSPTAATMSCVTVMLSAYAALLGF